MEIYSTEGKSRLELDLLLAMRGRRPELHQTYGPQRSDPQTRPVFFDQAYVDILTFASLIAGLTKENLPYWSRTDEEAVSQTKKIGTIHRSGQQWVGFPLRFNPEEYFPAIEGKPVSLIVTLGPTTHPGQPQDVIAIPRLLVDAAYNLMKEPDPTLQDRFLYLLLCRMAHDKLLKREQAIGDAAKMLREFGFSNDTTAI